MSPTATPGRSVDAYGGQGTPNFSSYQRCTRASLRISTSAATPANTSRPRRITRSSAALAAHDSFVPDAREALDRYRRLDTWWSSPSASTSARCLPRTPASCSSWVRQE